MSQGQDWNSPGATPPYQPYQPYQQQPAGQGYPPPQGQYAVAPSQMPYPPGYAAPPAMQVVPKNAGLALLISFFIPGVGSMYAGKTNTGVIILIGYVVSWVLSVVFIGLAGVLGFWVWGLIDAYKAAQEWNQAHGILS